VKRALVQLISAMAHHGFLEPPAGESLLEFLIRQCALPPDEVKRALVQLISAMAHHGFLEPPAGESLLEFLIRQCALPPDEPSGIPEENSEDPTSGSVRSVSVSTLLLLSSTVPSMSHVLWPFLLEFLLPAPFSPALTPLCRSLAFLAGKIREEPPEKSPERRGNLPSPQALLVRLLAVSCRPFLDPGRGEAALRLLRLLPPQFSHPELQKTWEEEIPILLEQLR
ncbi:maestro heat-like repeat-containing protein family member 1, partial [Cyanistes caeruleus]|uniref:maestro heat-like repeat-containing protein family member 1 n=1 Tax=Cyanistes caeruleus TaxID=156563 RepID=UPI000CDB7ECC